MFNINLLPWHQEYLHKIYIKFILYSKIYLTILMVLFISIYMTQTISIKHKQRTLINKEIIIKKLRKNHVELTLLQQQYQDIQQEKIFWQEMMDTNNKHVEFLNQLKRNFSQLMYLNKLNYTSDTQIITLEGTTYSLTALNSFINSFSAHNKLWLENLQLNLLTKNNVSTSNNLEQMEKSNDINNGINNSNANNNNANNFKITTKYNIHSIGKSYVK